MNLDIFSGNLSNATCGTVLLVSISLNVQYVARTWISLVTKSHCFGEVK